MTIAILPWTGDQESLGARIREELWHGSGCAVVRGLNVDDPEKATAQYRQLAEQIGPVLPQTVSGVELYSVRDQGYTLERDYGRAGVRTSMTTAAFGFHTDSPSRLAGPGPLA